MYYSFDDPQTVSYEDLDILYIGPSFHITAPTVFYFSLKASDSLFVDPYNQPIVELLKNRSIRVISITLPFHDRFQSEDAMAAWAQEITEGRDPLTPFIEKATSFIEHLKEKSIVDESQLALMGLSRGGWMACQIGARTKVKAIIGYAPLTRFSTSPRYANAKNQARSFDLDGILHNLVGTSIHFWISTKDVRVSTKNCFELIEKIVEKSLDEGIRSPKVYLKLVPPLGALGHGTSKESFIEGAQWAMKEINP